MKRKQILALAGAVLCLCTAPMGARAAQVDCDGVYCFSPEDLSEEDLTGICITGLPDAQLGAVMLGNRVVRPGDILTSQQISQMTFDPVLTQEDQTVSVTYLPIYKDHVAPCATVTIAIRGKTDKAPAAEDFALETYKNLPLEGKLKVSDPEGQALTFTVTRQGRRGTVEVGEDGSFLYTPKKNKVGVDSFTYTAADPAGNVSREATVTVTILKPTDAPQYTDTLGESCRFAAEWMKNTGIFQGENLAGNTCFSPDKEVSRGEFLTMLVKALELPVEDEALDTVSQDAPQWLRPYLAAALRSGLTNGIPDATDFRAAITQAEAAVLVQNALDLENPGEETVMAEDTIPQWARMAVEALAGAGIQMEADKPLTRADAAQLLYQASQLAKDAPGMDVFRMQG
jgi:VCBS repeat-containing protein